MVTKVITTKKTQLIFLTLIAMDELSKVKSAASWDSTHFHS